VKRDVSWTTSSWCPFQLGSTPIAVSLFPAALYQLCRREGLKKELAGVEEQLKKMDK
jgi:hypothetical protein